MHPDDGRLTCRPRRFVTPAATRPAFRRLGAKDGGTIVAVTSRDPKSEEPAASEPARKRRRSPVPGKARMSALRQRLLDEGKVALVVYVDQTIRDLMDADRAIRQESRDAFVEEALRLRLKQSPVPRQSGPKTRK